MKKGLLSVTLLIVLSVFLMAAVLFVVVVPITPCKGCAIRARYNEAVWQEGEVIGGIKVMPTGSPPPVGCNNCIAGKRTLLKTWFMRRQEGR